MRLPAGSWAKHGIKPHRLEGYLSSNDPHFGSKAADVIGRYLNPPQHAALFRVDEKTAIQALDTGDPRQILSNPPPAAANPPPTRIDPIAPCSSTGATPSPRVVMPPSISIDCAEPPGLTLSAIAASFTTTPFSRHHDF